MLEHVILTAAWQLWAKAAADCMQSALKDKDDLFELVLFGIYNKIPKTF